MTRNGLTGSTGLKHFYCLELYNQTFRPKSKSHLLTHHLLTFLKTLSHFFYLQGAQARTPLHYCISQLESDTRTSTERTGKGALLESTSQPASSDLTDTDQIHHHYLQSALARVSLHQPASQLITDQQSSRSPPLKCIGTDSSTSKQQSSSQLHTVRNQPKSTGHSNTDPLPPDTSPPASLMVINLILANQDPLWPPTPALHFTDRNRTVYPA